MLRGFCIAALAACAAAQSISDIDAEISRLTALRTQHVRRQADVNPRMVTENDNVVNGALSFFFSPIVQFLGLQPRFAPTCADTSLHGEQPPHRSSPPKNLLQFAS